MSTRTFDALRRLHNNVIGAVILETRMRYLYGPESPETKEAGSAANEASRDFWAHVDRMERDGA